MTTITKRVLADTFKDMLKTKPINRITVKELVETCDVKRQTFYYHFQDVYDLLGWIYQTEAIESIDNSRSYENWEEGLLSVLRYVENNEELCINTYHSLAREHLERFLNKAIDLLIGDVVKELGKPFDISAEHTEFITKFYSFAFTGTLLDWIGTGMNESCEEIANNISTTVEGNFLPAIKRFSKIYM